MKLNNIATKLAPFGAQYGAGGRNSNSGITATVFGAYGSTGRYFINELGSRGSRAYIPFRGCELEVRHLRPMFDLGQIGLMPFSPREEESIRETMKKSDIVVNMIGKYYETRNAVPTRRADGSLSRVNYSFEEVNVVIAERIARIAKEEGVKAFVHVSALSANLESKSVWSRTKAEGELAVLKQFPEAIVVRPATIFGPEDRFLNWIADGLVRLPVFPLVDGGKTLVQPIYSADVGKALMAIVYEHERLAGKVVELAGPAEYTHKEIVEYVMDVTMRNTPLMNVPLSAAHLAGSVVEHMVSPVLSRDLVAQLQEDNVIQHDSPHFNIADLGIEPVSMDKTAFDFLHRFRKGGHFVLAKGYH